MAWCIRLKTLAVALAWCGLTIVVGAQTLELEVAPTTVALDDVVTAVVRLVGDASASAPLTRPTLRCPSFAVEALAPHAGRRTANGRQWRYLLVPVEAGPARVDAVLAHGSADLTASVDLVVLADVANRASESRDDITGVRFVTASVDEPSVYIHEQVLYRFRYYFETWLPTGDTPQYGFPPFDGFSAERAGETPADDSRRARVDGRSFYVEEIDMALFPIVSGNLEIGPTRLVLPRAVSGGRDLLTESLRVKVLPLPRPTPADFSGAVGEFTVSVSVSDARIPAGEGARVVVEVRGRGDLDTITTGPSASSPHGEVFRGAVRTRGDVIDGKVGGARTYEFVLVARAAGVAVVDIPPLVTFSPARAQYVSSDPQQVRVTVTSAAVPPPPEPRPAVPWLKRLLAAAATVLAACVAVGVFILLRRRGQTKPTRPRRTATPAETTDALAAIEMGDGERVCRDVDEHVRAYASAALGVHAIDLSSALRDDPTSAARAVAAILTKCEEGMYAPSPPTDAQQTALVRDAVVAVEQFAGRASQPG